MNPLDESIETIKNMQKVIEEQIENSDDVKEGINTKEEEMQEPQNLLFTKISESVILTLQNPDIINGFAVIHNSGFGKEATEVLINIIAITAATTAFNAMTFYDGLLKEELTKQFDHIANHINNSKSDIQGIMSACEVYKKKIGELENQLKLMSSNKI